MNNPSSNRLSGFDMLRGLAALSVAFPHMLLLHYNSHAWETVSIVAVEIFFALSGFVLAPQIMILHKNASNYNLWAFFLRRWIRTIAPYLIALFLIAVLTGNFFSILTVKKMFFIDSFFSVPSEDYFAISWSLAVEEWYYVVAALAVFIFRNTRLLSIFLTLAFVFFIIKITGMFLDSDWTTSVRRATIYRLDAISFGFILYLAKDKLPISLLTVLISTVFSLFFVLFLLDSHASTLFTFERFWMLAAVYSLSIFSLCVVHSFNLLSPIIDRLKLNGFSTFLGNISYPVYLFHLPFGYAITSMEMPVWTTVAVSMTVVVIFSWLFNQLIEQPLIVSRPEYMEKIKPPSEKTKIDNVGANNTYNTTHRAYRGTPYAIILSWAKWTVSVLCVVIFAELAATAYLKFEQPKLLTTPFYSSEDSSKLGTVNIFGALDPQLGYSHPKRLALETKKYSVSQIDGYGVHRPKQGSFNKIVVLGGSTSDPFLAIKKRHPPWTKYLYLECRKLGNCGVWNGGVGGFGSPQELIRLIRDVVPEKPNLVISLHGPNELNRIQRAPFTTGFQNEKLKKEASERTFWLNNWMPNLLIAWAWIRNKNDMPAIKQEIYYGYKSTQTPFERWKTNVIMMNAISESQGFTYITALQPLVGFGTYEPAKSVLAASKRSKSYYQSVATFYEQATEFCDNVKFCINLSDAFKGESENLYTDIRHPNDLGNQIIAKKLFEEMLQRKIVP